MWWWCPHFGEDETIKGNLLKRPWYFMTCFKESYPEGGNWNDKLHQCTSNASLKNRGKCIKALSSGSTKKTKTKKTWTQQRNPQQHGKFSPTIQLICSFRNAFIRTQILERESYDKRRVINSIFLRYWWFLTYFLKYDTKIFHFFSSSQLVPVKYILTYHFPHIFPKFARYIK